MNLQLFFFKLLIIFYYIFRLVLFIAPVSIVLVLSKQGGWKYGFTFIQNSVEVGLYSAFAIAFVVGAYHAFSFEMLGEAPIENYLKSRQKVKVKGEISMEELAKIITKEFVIKDLKVEDQGIHFRKAVYFSFPDRVHIQQEDNIYFIDSRPFTKFWFIDFGRNFKTVKLIAQSIKGKT